MEIKSEISNLASKFLNKNFSIKADYIEIQNTRKDFEGDITIALFPFIKIFAPIRFNSATCMNLCSKISSVIKDFLFALHNSTIICACRSVGNPG